MPATTPASLFRKCPVRILSIDGGGIRGAVSARFLANLERDLGGKLSDHFDYIAGTSAGGMLALFIAAGGTAAEAAQLFEPSRASKIMDKSLFDRIWPSALQAGPKYDGKGKRAVLKELFGDRRIQSATIPVLVTTYDPGGKSLLVFKSHGGEGSHDNPLMSEVADATSAAPVYFPSVSVGSAPPRWLIDGGIAANNPSMCAVAEVMKQGVDIRDVVLVSVGTGHPVPKASEIEKIAKKSKDWGGIDWLRHGIIDHIMDGASSSVDYICKQLLGGNYHRVQGPMEAGASSEMDNVDAANIEALKAMGDRWYLKQGREVRQALLNACLIHQRQPAEALVAAEDSPPELRVA